MSAFEEAIIQRIRSLEREVERLQRWERPTGGGGVTDHGDLTGLADDDHPQYLKVADSIDHGSLTGLGDDDHPQYRKVADSIDHGTLTGLADDDHPQYRKVADSIDHGTLSGLADNDHPQYLLTTGKAADSDKLDGLDSTYFATATHAHTGVYLPIAGKAADSDKLDGYDSTDFGRPVFLAAPKTSTSWDGDARSTTSATKIDTSDVFGIPDGVKALIVRVLARDSASFPNTSTYFQIGPASSANNQIRLYPVGGDIMATVTGICNCDANGDIYYSLASSGTETMDCWIEIWGYWL